MPITNGESARKSTGASIAPCPSSRPVRALSTHNGVLSQRTLQQPANSGGRFITAAAFVSDAIRVGSRVTINPGLRFDHSRAISQDVPEYDLLLQETGRTIEGRGTVDTWNIVSPRVGVVIKLDTAGRTMLRANAGRFSQGMLTGEIAAVHPGRTKNTIIREPSGVEVVRDPSQIELDPEIRPPHTDQYSIGIDREVSGRIAVSVAYVRKNGSDFIGWEEVAGSYREQPAQLNDGRVLQVLRLTHPFAGTPFSPDQSRGLPADLRRSDRRRRATPVPWLAGVWVLHVVESVRAAAFERHDGRWHTGRHRGFAAGVVRARGHLRAGSERSHQRPRPPAQRSPAHAPCHERSRRAAHRRCGRGQPAASQRQALGEDGAHQSERAGVRPVLIESRGTERLSSQTLLDFRVSRAFASRRVGRIDLRLDVLNALNDTAEESIRSEVYNAATVGQANIFIDPRRAMLSVSVEPRPLISGSTSRSSRFLAHVPPVEVSARPIPASWTPGSLNGAMTESERIARTSSSSAVRVCSR